MPVNVTIKVIPGQEGPIYDVTSDTPGTVVKIDDFVHLSAPLKGSGAAATDVTDSYGRPGKRKTITT